MSTPSSESLLVSDVMLAKGKFPVVSPKMLLKPALEEMGKARLGIICISGDDDMLAGGILALELALCLVDSRQEISPAAGSEPRDFRVKPPANAADLGQWDDDEGANVESDDADEIVVVELARHRLGGLLGIEDTIVLAHAP